MFENKIINGVHATRYIASWNKAGGAFIYREDYYNFRKWLLSIGLTDDDARHICRLADNGKLELENSAEKFIKELPPYEDED
jgi:hypothetical protein